MSDHQEAESLVERLRSNAKLQAAWHTFELGMPAPPPLHHRDTFDLLIEAADRLTLLEKAGEGTGSSISPSAATGEPISRAAAEAEPSAVREPDRLRSEALAATEAWLDWCHYDETLWDAYGESEEGLAWAERRRKAAEEALDLLTRHGSSRAPVAPARPESLGVSQDEPKPSPPTTSTHPRIEGEGEHISSVARADMTPPSGALDGQRKSERGAS